MANGAITMVRASATVYGGRASPSLYGGRASPALITGNGAAYGLGGSGAPSIWPRTGGMCAPIQQCCCLGPVTIAPGEIKQITINWANWIEGNPGFNMSEVARSDLYDMTTGPRPFIADPDIMKVTSGIADRDPDPPDNSDVAKLITKVPPYGTMAIIEAGPDAPIGAGYKLDICLVAHDCAGRMIRQCECVGITVAEC